MRKRCVHSRSDFQQWNRRRECRRFIVCYSDVRRIVSNSYLNRLTCNTSLYFRILPPPLWRLVTGDIALKNVNRVTYLTKLIPKINNSIEETFFSTAITYIKLVSLYPFTFRATNIVEWTEKKIHSVTLQEPRWHWKDKRRPYYVRFYFVPSDTVFHLSL